MEGLRARKGVLITTSNFSSDAKEYTSKIERKIVLIDGPTLAGYMIDYNIGVSTAQTYVLKKLDSDFFTEEP
jgi:restriction system protein